jgi:hypothetical protein
VTEPRPRIRFATNLGALGVHLSPGAAAHVVDAIQAVARLNGTPLRQGTPMRELVEVCRASVAAANPPAAQPGTSRPPADEIDSAQAAEILGITQHQVTVLAKAQPPRIPGARKVKQQWRFPRAAVEEYATWRRR